MGSFIHHAIIVTSQNQKAIEEAHHRAHFIFGSVSPLMRSMNDYSTFLIPPDGCKEGKEASEVGDIRRDTFVDWLIDKNMDIEWIEVEYGDSNPKGNQITRMGRKVAVKKSSIEDDDHD